MVTSPEKNDRMDCRTRLNLLLIDAVDKTRIFIPELKAYLQVRLRGSCYTQVIRSLCLARFRSRDRQRWRCGHETSLIPSSHVGGRRSKVLGKRRVIKANRIREVGAELYYRCLGREDRGKARRVLY